MGELSMRFYTVAGVFRQWISSFCKYRLGTDQYCAVDSTRIYAVKVSGLKRVMDGGQHNVAALNIALSAANGVSLGNLVNCLGNERNRSEKIHVLTLN